MRSLPGSGPTVLRCPTAPARPEPFATQVAVVGASTPVSFRVTQLAQQVFLCWPATAYQTTLQCSDSLGATAHWTTVAAPPSLVGNQQQVTLQPGKHNEFLPPDQSGLTPCHRAPGRRPATHAWTDTVPHHFLALLNGLGPSSRVGKGEGRNVGADPWRFRSPPKGELGQWPTDSIPRRQRLEKEVALAEQLAAFENETLPLTVERRTHASLRHPPPQPKWIFVRFLRRRALTCET